MIKQLKEALIAAGWELGFNNNESYNGLRAYKGGMYTVHHHAAYLRH